MIACFDGDAAGRRAAARSFPIFLEAGLWGRGAFLPAGDDPDSFVRTRGRDALEECLAAAEPLVDAYVLELAGPDRAAVGRRAEAARQIAQLEEHFGVRLFHRTTRKLSLTDDGQMLLGLTRPVLEGVEELE